MSAKQIFVTEAALAAHWGVGARRIRQMREQGLVAGKGDRNDLVESDRRFIAWLRSDEETKRSKRRLVAIQEAALTRKLEREDGHWLSLAEVKPVLDQAWGHLWNAVQGAASQAYAELAQHLPQQRATLITSEIESRFKGDLRLVRERIEELLAAGEESLRDPQRAQLFQSERRLDMLVAELGGNHEDDSEGAIPAAEGAPEAAATDAVATETGTGD